ncbi:hypothetical protein MAM1_0070d04116 [Mucor ambiguus]|uniref:PB1 domain-containing protein n=1 Tax=Mucor ambiguus TaxID=91626 RepID=A0A0C9LU99_9FUNG|nr:hypothetical protein MAM1_0070d04116 [Mucor ambiguus]
MTDYTNLRKIVTGDIIIKCRFSNEIRRIPINGVPTYDELCLMMYRVFKQNIKSSQDISLKYQDEDDIDITHAISISNLLKVTVYDKSNQPKQQQQQQHQQRPTSSAEISSLIEIREKLDHLIRSLTIEKKGEEPKEEQGKKIHRLTPAELASFLSNDTENTQTSSVKELTSLSPKAPSSGTIPYYPPPSNAPAASAMTTPNVATSQPQAIPQQQQQQQPQVQQQQQQPQQQPQPQIQQQQQQLPHPSSQPQMQPPYVQTPPPASQMPVSQQQQPRPPQVQQSFGHANQNGGGFIPYYPPPAKNEMRPPPQQQPQQLPQQRQGYFVPPPPPSMNTPQLPPQQPFRPPQHW